MDFTLESFHQGMIAGVDEAGRGPLAGPVIAAAVIVDRSKPIDGIKDSKKLSKTERNRLYTAITKNYIWSVGMVTSADIDLINILEATKKACILAVLRLSVPADIAIIDGNMQFSNPNFISYVKGDDRSISIAAASIVAKVTRDRLMTKLDIDFPSYGWAQNYGYGTKHHVEAIKKYGLSIHHRQSFKIRTSHY